MAGTGDVATGKDSPYDVLIIGAGQAAIPLAIELTGRKMRVAVAERADLGGSCVNFGCTPTKAVIASAKLAHDARRAAEFGLDIPVVNVDLAKVLASARAIVQESRDGLAEIFQDENPTLLHGHARLQGRDEAGNFRVQVGDTHHLAKQVVLDTGTHSKIPPVAGLSDISYINAENWLSHDHLPRELLVLGGGYIGLEMAQFYQRMGSRVTVVNTGEHIAEREDPATSDALQKILEDEGIRFQMCSRATEVQWGSDGVITLMVDLKAGGQETVRGTDLLIAVGRQPNTDQLGLETVGVTPHEDGTIPVDDRLAATVPGLWACGDIRGGGMFTHTSWDDHRILLSQITGDGSRTIAGRLVPYAIFTDPSLARVGMSEADVRKAGRPYRKGRYDMKHNGHAREFRATLGFIEVIVDGVTDELLGATALADNAGELIHVYLDVMNARVPFTTIVNGVYVHPTLMEAAQSATEAVLHPPAQ